MCEERYLVIFATNCDQNLSSFVEKFSSHQFSVSCLNCNSSKAIFSMFLNPFVGVLKLILLDDFRQLFHMLDD